MCFSERVGNRKVPFSFTPNRVQSEIDAIGSIVTLSFLEKNNTVFGDVISLGIEHHTLQLIIYALELSVNRQLFTRSIARKSTHKLTVPYPKHANGLFELMIAHVIEKNRERVVDRLAVGIIDLYSRLFNDRGVVAKLRLLLSAPARCQCSEQHYREK